MEGESDRRCSELLEATVARLNGGLGYSKTPCKCLTIVNKKDWYYYGLVQNVFIYIMWLGFEKYLCVSSMEGEPGRDSIHGRAWNSLPWDHLREPGNSCSWSRADRPCGINFPFLANTDLCLIIHTVSKHTVESFRIFRCLQLSFANFICRRATAAEAA